MASQQRRKPLYTQNELERIARYGPPEGVQFRQGSNAAALASLAGRVFAVQDTFAQRFDAIEDDPLLSEAGKVAARRALAEEHLQEVQNVRLGDGTDLAATREITTAQRKKYQAELDRASKLTERDSPADAIRDCYLWDLLVKMDPLLRPIAFAEAIEEGDAELFAAFVRAPKMLKLLDSKDRDEGITAWNSRIDPERARDVRELGVADALVTSAVANARQFIQEAAGLPGAEPLRVLAGAEPAGQ